MIPAAVVLDKKHNTLIETFFERLRPPPDFTIDEWADINIELPAGTPEPGPWRTSRVPYMREIFYEMSPKSPTTDICLMKGTQIAATTLLIIAAGFYVKHAPGPIMINQPTVDDAQVFSTGKMTPLFNASKPVRDKIYKSKSRDGTSTILHKSFAGGEIFIGGANSSSALASKTVQYLLNDEIDRWPDDVDGEGDPREIVRKRTSNYGKRAKRFDGSSPTVADGKMDRLFKSSDQRYYYVPCPHCGEMQIIKWENIVYKNDAGDIDLNNIYLRCVNSIGDNPKCSGKIPEHHKTRMLDLGQWRKHNPTSEIAGFHLSGLYSPLGWYSWRDGVKAHLDSIGDLTKRKVWVNTFLGEPWEELALSSIDPSWLKSREEPYLSEVPQGALVLTCGVDTHDDRLEAQVVGWGVKNESWIIDYSVFMGDPNKKESWDELDVYLQRLWNHENGGQTIIAGTCIDARGHRTDAVYNYCAPRRMRNVFPVLGQPGSGRQLIIKYTKSSRAQTIVFHVGVDGAKSTLYSRLLIKDPGPGYVHFPTVLPTFAEKRELSEQYFSGLTAEKKIEYRRLGLPAFKWELPSGKRNEQLDTYIYSMAALTILNPNLELLAKENRIYMRSATQRRGIRIISKGVE